MIVIPIFHVFVSVFNYRYYWVAFVIAIKLETKSFYSRFMIHKHIVNTAYKKKHRECAASAVVVEMAENLKNNPEPRRPELFLAQWGLA